MEVPVALIINGQPIDDAIVQSEFAQIKAYFENLGNVSCCERDDEFRGYAKQNVIARALLAQEALRRTPPAPDAEVDAAIAKLMEEYGGESRFYSATGASPEQMHLVRDLRVKRLTDDLCADLSPGEAELQAFYERNIAAYMTPEEVRASHILKSPKRGEARAGAYEELRKLRAELRAGADFDALAKAHSDKADEHIDLGFFKKGELAEEFETVAFSLDVDEVSPVFVSPWGYHLIKLTARKPSAAKPFEEVRADVEQHLRESRRQERTRALVETLKGSAVIEEVEDVPATAEVV
jgi:parvulin-like peptidyl-prolyl isomerase